MKNFKFPESFLTLKSMELRSSIALGKPFSDSEYARFKEMLDWLFMSGFYTLQQNNEIFDSLIELHLASEVMPS